MSDQIYDPGVDSSLVDLAEALTNVDAQSPIDSANVTFGDALPMLSRLSAEGLRSLAVRYQLGGSIGAVSVDQIDPPMRSILLQRLAELAVDELEGVPLRELIPGALGSERMSADELDARSFNALKRRNLLEWTDLAKETPATLLALRNVGRKSVAGIVSVAVERALQAFMLAKSRPDQRDEERELVPDETAVIDPDDVLDPLGLVLAWSTAEYGIMDLRDALIAALSSSTPVIVDAFVRMSSADLSIYQERHKQRFDVAAAVDGLLSSIEARDLQVLRDRVVTLDRRRTLEEVGRDLGLTRERVRQLETRATSRIQARVHQPSYAIIRERATKLRTTLGVAFPFDDARRDDEVVRVVGDDPKSLRGRLLLWLAGPYALRDGWLVVTDAATNATTRLRTRLEEDSAELREAVDLLVNGGFVESAAQAWILDSKDLRLFGTRVVLWHSSAAERFVRVLEQSGRPMTLAELTAEIPDRNPRYIANALLGDERTVRTGIRSYGLRAWGLDEYTTIADEIEQELTRRGGESNYADLSATLVERYGLSASSVNTYACSRQYERSGGLIRFRLESPFNPDGFARAIEYTPACFRIDGGWAWRVRVDEQIMRGSGKLMPAGFANEIGLTPGSLLSLPSPYGEVHLSWRGLQPQWPSMRQPASDLGAVLGDFLLLKHDDAHGAISYLRIAGTALEGMPPLERISMLTGGLSRHGHMGIDQDVGRALGFPDFPVASLRAILRRLRARREPDLADQLTVALDETTNQEALVG